MDASMASQAAWDDAKKISLHWGCKVESVRFKVDFGPIQLREEGPKLTVEASHLVEKVQA